MKRILVQSTLRKKDEYGIRRGLGWRTDACGFRHWWSLRKTRLRVRVGIVMGVVLLLLRRGGACIVLASQTKIGKVTEETKRLQQPVYMTPRSMQTEVVDHAM